KIQLDISLSPDITQAFLLDKSRLTRILLNLLSNAIKFSPNGGKITISAHLKKINEKNFLSLHVKDNGIGIPADKLTIIFDRFTRVFRSDEKYPGLGLGLHIAQQFAKDMNGYITVESSPEKGTLFECRLPCVTAEEPA